MKVSPLAVAGIGIAGYMAWNLYQTAHSAANLKVSVEGINADASIAQSNLSHLVIVLKVRIINPTNTTDRINALYFNISTERGIGIATVSESVPQHPELRQIMTFNPYDDKVIDVPVSVNVLHLAAMIGAGILTTTGNIIQRLIGALPDHVFVDGRISVNGINVPISFKSNIALGSTLRAAYDAKHSQVHGLYYQPGSQQWQQQQQAMQQGYIVPLVHYPEPVAGVEFGQYYTPQYEYLQGLEHDYNG